MKPFPKSLNPDTLPFWIRAQKTTTPFDTYLRLCTRSGLYPQGKGSPSGAVRRTLKTQRRLLIRWFNENNVFDGLRLQDIRTMGHEVTVTDNGFSISISFWLRKSSKNFVTPLRDARFEKFKLYSPNMIHRLKISSLTDVYATNPFVAAKNQWQLKYVVRCPYLPPDLSSAELLQMWKMISSSERLNKTVRNV